VVVAEGVGGAPADELPAVVPAPLDHPHLLAWRDAFRSFGVKPKRAVCSAEALIARGELPRINPLVDRYNAVSVRLAVPVGGEDLARVVPPVRLVFATGDEPFDGGDPPRPGEVVWLDGLGVTCRRWNWRQGARTRLTEETARAYFLFDARLVGRGHGRPRGAVAVRMARRPVVLVRGRRLSGPRLVGAGGAGRGAPPPSRAAIRGECQLRLGTGAGAPASRAVLGALTTRCVVKSPDDALWRFGVAIRPLRAREYRPGRPSASLPSRFSPSVAASAASRVASPQRTKPSDCRLCRAIAE
jgi:hypothetical protein